MTSPQAQAGERGVAPVAAAAPSCGTGGTDQTPTPIRLQDQLCFPLYACSKEVVRRYAPLLDPLGLTYTQYICMMVLWEEGEATVSHLGERVLLDSGTLTPLLRKLEEKGYVTRERGIRDARQLIVRLTPEGRELERRAASVPRGMLQCVDLPIGEAAELKRLLLKVLGQLRQDQH